MLVALCNVRRLIKYTQSLTPKTNFAISIEDLKYSVDVAKETEPKNEMRLTALVVRINHKFDNGSIISGCSFVAEKKTAADEEWAWGVGLGGKYQMTPKTMLKADYYHVKDDGRLLLWSNQSYIFDAQNQMQVMNLMWFQRGLTY